jgi:hypothetical protein
MAEDKELFYKSNIEKEVLDEAIEFVNKLQHQFQERSWDCLIRTSYNVNDNILNCRNLINLKRHIQFHLDEFMYSRDCYYDGYIKNSWINIYEKGFYQEFHHHISDIDKSFSGVLYLTENNSDIEFDIDNRKKITPQLGDILIFDDDRLHRVCPNNNDSLRISLAFNFVKKKKWEGLLLEK